MPDDTTTSPPPKGDFQKAEKYVSTLVRLLDQDKVKATKTDLSRFNPSSLQDHYRLDLTDYIIEISRSKNPDSGHESYVMIFTNLRQVAEGACEKEVLAYMNLNEGQFGRVSEAAADHVERTTRVEEEARLEEALAPIDQILSNADDQTATGSEQHNNSHIEELPSHTSQRQFHLN